MTTQFATSYLPRPENLSRDARRKPLGDQALVLLFGVIGWPWLLRSLSGGSKEARAAVLERLSLDAAALPHLGSWKADARFLSLIADEIFGRKPQTVVELGCGATSLAAAKALAMNGEGRLFGFDQYEDYVASVRDWLASQGLEADLAAAPLTRRGTDWPGRWYDIGEAPERIDLLIVDGPHWAVHPFVRGAADRLFPRIPVGGAVLLDDAARPGERIVAARWRKRWPGFEFRLERSGTKGTLIGRRLR
jgi:predicted O-methyltransferase YrrM